MSNKRPLLQAALNGDRVHPWVPHTPEIAAQAAAAVAAGAQSVHVHVFDDDGRQTLAAGPAARVLQAVRASCPGVPISLSTSADIEPDPASRFRALASWTELPDLVTANQGEVGIVELCGLLASRGVGIEAGLLSLDDAQAFVAADMASSTTGLDLYPRRDLCRSRVVHGPGRTARSGHCRAGVVRCLSSAGVGSNGCGVGPTFRFRFHRVHACQFPA